MGIFTENKFVKAVQKKAEDTKKNLKNAAVETATDAVKEEVKKKVTPYLPLLLTVATIALPLLLTKKPESRLILLKPNTINIITNNYYK